MQTLSTMQCEACRADAPRVTDEELTSFIKQIPNWQPIVEDDILKLVRCYSFNNFVEAMSFAQKVGELAEQYDHHPAILTEWGSCTVTWWTHKIKGLHRNDFILAAKTDEI